MPDSPNDQTSNLEQWIARSNEGDSEALNRLAEYLLPKAFEFASRKMRRLSPMDDFEDIAISAVKSVCNRFQQGKTVFFGELELEQLLRRFIKGKIRDRQKYHLAEKRNVNRSFSQDTAESRVAGASDWDIGGAAEGGSPVWLDELSTSLPVEQQSYLRTILADLGNDVQGLFSELVKRLDDKPRKVLLLVTTRTISNQQLADELDCAPSSIERYCQAIRRKLEQIVNQ